MDGLNLVINITDRDKTETAIKLFQENGVFTTDVALGQGTAPREILEYLYLSPAEKAIIFGVVTNAGLNSLFKTLKRKMFIDVPGNGIAVAVPLNSIGGRRSLEYMLDGQVLETNKSLEMAERIERMSIKTDYELIFVVANEGYSDMIMDAAREAGAGGGTVLHAKGTGSTRGEKFFGVSLADEKDMVYIIAHADEKAAIMRAISEKAGPGTKAGAICFSLPISSVAGLREREEI